MNVTNLQIETLKKEILEEINSEDNTKAKAALKQKYKNLKNAKAIVANIEREIADLEQSIVDGSFVG
jgi:hypothetical protein